VQFIRDKNSLVYNAETMDYPPQLVGFVVIGNFRPGDDPKWPAWKNKKIPPNDKLMEIKLLGCNRGVGRILFSWALIKCNRSKHKAAVVLEVLCGKENQLAIDFYRSFGFSHEIAYDVNVSRFTQVRNVGQITYFMVKLRNRKGTYLSRERLQKLLTYKLISRKSFPEIEYSEIQKQLEKEDFNLYCVHDCRFGGFSTGTMICCDRCNGWYHLECVGLSQKKSKEINEYYCVKCTGTPGDVHMYEQGNLNDVDWGVEKKSEESWDI